jgi:hypothetical protein
MLTAAGQRSADGIKDKVLAGFLQAGIDANPNHIAMGKSLFIKPDTCLCSPLL